MPGRSRSEAFPQVAHSGRASTAAWEEANGDLAAMAADRAGSAVRRRVDGAGTVSVCNRNDSIGKLHERTTFAAQPEVG